jgi:hypothetical protein
MNGSTTATRTLFRQCGGNALFLAFCTAVLSALVLETTVFNFPYYLRYFAGPQCAIVEQSPTDPKFILTDDGVKAELIEDGVRFYNLDRSVTSVFVNANFDHVKTAEMHIKSIGELGTYRYSGSFHNGSARNNYARLLPCGNVSELTITFKFGSASAAPVNLSEIVINKPIPFYFSGPRFLFVSLLLFVFFASVSKNLRAKAVRCLSGVHNNLLSADNPDYAVIFTAISCLLFLAFAAELLNNPLGPQRTIFFDGMNDLFADFFNNLRYIAEKDPYLNPTLGRGEKIYLPLTYLILYPFSQLDNFAVMSLQEARNSTMGLMSCFLFICLSVFLLIAALRQLTKKYSVSFMVLIGLALSSSFLFSIERANTLIASAACVVFFICNYDSECRHRRLWAAISLALAATLKIYPALFGLLYLERKRYRELFFCAGITLLLVFVPYLYFKGGFGNIRAHIDNLKSMQRNYGVYRVYPRFSLSHLAYCCSALLKFSPDTAHLLSSAANVVNTLASVISIIFSLLQKNRWLKISLLTMPLLFMPVNSGWYCGLYMFPMIVLFFSTTRERTKSLNIFIIAVFIAFLNPFQIAFLQNGNTYPSVNYLIANMALFSLWSVLLILSGKHIATDTLLPFYRKLVKEVSKDRALPRSRKSTPT